MKKPVLLVTRRLPVGVLEEAAPADNCLNPSTLQARARA